MPTAALNGIDVHYERAGEGPRLLFVNGSGSTLVEAKPMLDRLRAHFDVLAHDQRGLGLTAIPDGPYTMVDYAADAAALATHAGWERYRVCGISFGGMVAQELAVTVPERILAERLASRGRESPDDIAGRLARAAAFQVDGSDVLTLVNDGPLARSVESFVAVLRALPDNG